NIKATLDRLSGRGKKKRQKLQRDKRDRLREKAEQEEAQKVAEKLQVTEFISVQELANMMDVPATDVIMACMNLGVIVSINQRLDAEVIELIASEFGHEVEFITAEEQADEEVEIVDDPEDLVPRAPIVTVMGHVDHGKTSLLDYIRKAKVAEGEAGGITQHIGAYEVNVDSEDGPKAITFLDTPGHEAFTAMRARGAKVTDIAIIIIAADDNIMPQTREAISHAQAAGVPMVFAINKIDKPGANPERIKQELASMNLLVEEWGGEYQSQDISAKTGEGVDELLEKILLVAELLELKANPNRMAIGVILEASLDKGRGYVSKALVQTGTLHIGDPIVAGEYSGKVKAMFNERGKRVKAAGPSTPVLVLGLNGAPQAGERFKETETETEARQIAAKRAQIAREQSNRATKRISLDEIGRRLALGTFKELNLIVKGDVDGSIEALSDSLIKLSQETVQVNVIHKAVGQIIESDVLLASASDAIIIGFQVRPSPSARKLAEREGVQIKTYSIIYEAIDEIKSAIEGMLEPTKEEKIVCNVEVREVYKISKVGTVAGCFVLDGKITRNTNVRVIRNGIVVYPTKEGSVAELGSLKRFKEDVREVKAGLECGLTIKNFNDLKVGDIIEGFEIVETKQTLKL
ncbi:MAG: translation initiation factor IF-2, partial [Bacteroidetes bacterium]